MFGTMLSDSIVTTAGQVPETRKSASAIRPTTPTTQIRSRAMPAQRSSGVAQALEQGRVCL